MQSVTDDEALMSLSFSDDYAGGEILNGEVAKVLKDELIAYHAGVLMDFTLKLQPQGTLFQQQVWNDLRTIPYGKTITYQQQAKLSGKVSNIRATASANGKNPVMILIPCHRVVGLNGSLTGYAGGLWRKAKLLNLESRSKQTTLFKD
jgi:methylated-DNA-[protein]-cysteine S-methyltransferase